MTKVITATEKHDLVETPVWDLPVRLFHWTFVVAVSVSWISGKAGRFELHYISGLIVLALVLFRILWGIFGSPTARFRLFLKGPRAAMSYLRHAFLRRAPSHTFGHNPAGGLIVALFLLVIGIQAFTGLANSDDVFFEGPLRDNLPEWMVSIMSRVHRPISYIVLVLVALHVAAVLGYFIFKRENLVKPMVTGRAVLPRATAEDAVTSGATRRAPLLRAVFCAMIAAVPPAAIYWLN